MKSSGTPRTIRTYEEVAKLTKCPHCGSLEGYAYKLRINGIQYNSWGNNDTRAYFVDTGGKHFRYLCVSCIKEL